MYVAVILKVWFSNSLYRTIVWALAMKLLSGECHRISLMVSQYWCRLGALRQHAITWANVGPDLCRHMVSLGHNEVTHCGRDKIAAILQTAFSNSFWLKKLLYFDSYYVLGGPINNKPALPKDNALVPKTRQTIIWTSQWWTRLLMHICLTWTRGVDSASVKDLKNNSHWQFEERRSICENIIQIFNIRKHFDIIMRNVVVSAMIVGDLAPVGAGTSANTVVTE